DSQLHEVSGDVERSTAGVPAGGQAVPEYFAKGVEFSVHRPECVAVAGEIASSASFASNGEGTGTGRRVGRQQSLGFSIVRCVSRERKFFLEVSASFDLNHDE